MARYPIFHPVIKLIIGILVGWNSQVSNAEDYRTRHNDFKVNHYPVKSGGPYKQHPELSQGIFLIAGRNLNDPNFNKSVILITDFNETGTTGLIINKSTDIHIDQVLPQFSQWNSITRYLNIGGPVATRSFSLLVRSSKDLPASGSKHIIDDIYLINTMEMLNYIPDQDENKTFFKLYLGYAGWSPGQLESELLRGDWHLWHAEADLIFETEYSEIWHQLIELVSAKWVFVNALELFE